MLLDLPYGHIPGVHNPSVSVLWSLDPVPDRVGAYDYVVTSVGNTKYFRLWLVLSSMSENINTLNFSGMLGSGPSSCHFIFLMDMTDLFD